MPCKILIFMIFSFCYEEGMSRSSDSYAHLANLKMLEDLYANWMEDPKSVDLTWQNFFEGMEFASHLPQALPMRQESADLRVFYLITAYRTYGHLKVECNPIATEPLPMPEELKLERYGLSSQDLESSFPTFGFLSSETAPLKEIIAALEKTYCHRIGIEYMGLCSSEMEAWIQKRIEPGFPTHLGGEELVGIYEQLSAAEGFEAFLHTKYVGQKRFSLEGAETLIPMLRAILDTGSQEGISDILLGMAHRGRLNVLANIMGKSYSYIFEEFEDHYTPDLSEATGDVKYHMGFASTYQGPSGKKVQIILSANPSHLESVNPVVQGGARAVQELKKSHSKQLEVLPIVTHGDASVAGQGVVYETMGMCHLNGYGVKGTLHIVINNQIGFTTLPKDSRSTRYCTDIAKAFGAPILHVNAEDPEGCVAAASLAIALRQTFGTDVFIDLCGYRKYGHNEGDEPTFTQPLQYQLIHSKKSICTLYREELLARGVMDENRAKSIDETTKKTLESALETVKSKAPSAPPKIKHLPKERHLGELLAPVETAVPEEQLRALAQSFCSVPDGFNLSPKLRRLLESRLASLDGQLDWSMGELLAYASLAIGGTHVRLSGQDVRRGTFSHRHALWVDQVTSAHYFPLSHLGPNQAPCDFFNSSLSEYAVMGFEYGYSLMYPNSLVLWEGQFGDFANGAQIIIDQYLTASEMKWGIATNLTLLLPHGYEGQGSEHSSARIERFLQMCGDENMIVANCTTPAQLFHLLRRQALRSLKKPLVVFTPKALLRHPDCKSPLSDLSQGHFEEVVDDSSPAGKTERLAFCSGKIYYQLRAEREKRGASDLTLIRIEQLYPLHKEKIQALIERYKGFSECLWVQEEHANMGASDYIRPQLEALVGMPVRYVGRGRASSTAAGSHTLHKLQDEALLKELFEEKTK
jgi:2-oxoglutarate dehydrogenase E1 component